MYSIRRYLPVLSAIWLASAAVPSAALVEISDEQMSEVSGAGIAIVLEDIRITASPTSFLEFTGSAPGSAEFERGDIRWYGISITGTDASAGSTWSGACGAGLLDLGCAQGGYVTHFAPHDNPLLLRAFDYERVDGLGNPGVSRTVLEVLFPSDHEPYRFAFWGELNVNQGAGGKLQVQNIWNNVNQGGGSLRIFNHVYGAGFNDNTFGLIFTNYFEADIRMSLAQSFLSPDVLGMVPEFEEYEGLYANDFRVFFPMGQMHYQALIADDVPASGGNFVLEQTLVPNDEDAYNHFYGRTIAHDPTGGYDRTESVRNALGSYHETHGYLRIGDWVGTQNYSYYDPTQGDNGANGNPAKAHGEPAAGACMPDRVTCTKNGRYDTTDGLFFSSYAGGSFTNRTFSPHTDNSRTRTPSAATESMNTINLGDAQISGMLVHHMKITTCAGLSTSVCLGL